jgi:hypothetical protein
LQSFKLGCLRAHSLLIVCFSICSNSGEVVSLETRKRSLEAGMRERRSEIEMQLELMQARQQALPFHSSRTHVCAFACLLQKWTPSTFTLHQCNSPAFSCSPSYINAKLQGEARLLKDEVHRVASELQARQLVLQKLRRKHETLVLKRRCQDGEAGTVPQLGLKRAMGLDFWGPCNTYICCLAAAIL